MFEHFNACPVGSARSCISPTATLKWRIFWYFYYDAYPTHSPLRNRTNRRAFSFILNYRFGILLFFCFSSDERRIFGLVHGFIIISKTMDSSNVFGHWYQISLLLMFKEKNICIIFHEKKWSCKEIKYNWDEIFSVFEMNQKIRFYGKKRTTDFFSWSSNTTCVSCFEYYHSHLRSCK